MQAVLLWSAAITSIVTFAVHVFAGGVYVARPLLADQTLPKASKWLNYYCWHITSVLILFLGAAFAFSAIHPDRLELAAFAAALTLTLAALSALVALKGRIHPLRFPSTSLFALTACFGWAGVVSQ